MDLGYGMSHLAKINLAIIAMAASIYLIRLLGFWLAGFIHFSDRVKIWFEYLPGCLLTAVLASDFESNMNGIELLAAAVVVVIMIKSNNIFVAILSGAAMVSGWRYLGSCG